MLMAGLAVSLIVRDNGVTVNLVSPAIVFGIMEDQAWPCRTSDVDDERFEDIQVSCRCRHLLRSRKFVSASYNVTEERKWERSAVLSQCM